MRGLRRGLVFVFLAGVLTSRIVLILVVAALSVVIMACAVNYGIAPSAGFGIHLVVLALLLATVYLGTASFIRQVRYFRTLARAVRAAADEVCPRLGRAIAAAGLEAKVVRVADHMPFAFTYGFLRPRVVVSQGLIDQLTDEELTAVLVHERCHADALDPLKTLVARIFSDVFFYAPVVPALLRGYAGRRELIADRHAVESCGRVAVAGALYKVVRGPVPEHVPVAMMANGSELLEARLAQLETGHLPHVAAVRLRHIVVSLPALMFVVATVTALVATCSSLVCNGLCICC